MDHSGWFVYLARCSDGSLYCGITNDLKKRLLQHNSGKGAKYTRSRRPIELVASSLAMTKSDALKLEYRVKQVTAHHKINELRNGANEMDKNLEKELKAVSRQIMKLSKTLDKMSAVDAKEKKAKATKKAPTVRVPATETPIKPSAADIVLEVISKSENGIDTAGLMKETGFIATKIRNLTSRLKKQGKIQNKARGVFVCSIV